MVQPVANGTIADAEQTTRNYDLNLTFFNSDVTTRNYSINLQKTNSTCRLVVYDNGRAHSSTTHSQ